MAQLVRAPPCHGGGRRFESDRGRSCKIIDFAQEKCREYILLKINWDLSSAGRASALQAEGHRFEPYRSHFKKIEFAYILSICRCGSIGRAADL